MRYVFDSFVLDGATRELVAAGTPVRIEPKVLDLILHLIGARDRVVTKDELVEAVWQGRIISDAAISSAISAARRARGDDGQEQRYIKTAHGRGFRVVGALVEIDDGGSLPALDIDLLRTFALVAENESVAQAAELVDRPQASVASQVERLESLVGRPLLDRGSGGLVQLTPEGRSLLRPARELLSMSDDIVASFRARPQADEIGAGGSDRQRSELSEARGSPWDRPSLAVLPFRNMSDDPRQEYFSDGMVEDIVAALSRISWLRVTAHSSGLAYKNRAVDPRQAGRELGVRYLLQGGVRRSGSRVRITAHLLDAESGTHLWADKYDSSLEDVFDLQDHIADRVAAVVEPSLRRSEIERSRGKPTESLGAYDLYLRALPHIAARMPDEQGGTGPVFQMLDLLGDGALGNAKFLCCGRKAAKPCRGLECPKCVERRRLGPGWSNGHPI